MNPTQEQLDELAAAFAALDAELGGCETLEEFQDLAESTWDSANARNTWLAIQRMREAVAALKT